MKRLENRWGDRMASAFVVNLVNSTLFFFYYFKTWNLIGIFDTPIYTRGKIFFFFFFKENRASLWGRSIRKGYWTIFLDTWIEKHRNKRFFAMYSGKAIESLILVIEIKRQFIELFKNIIHNWNVAILFRRYFAHGWIRIFLL